MDYQLILSHIVFQRTGIWPTDLDPRSGPFVLSGNESGVALSRWSVDGNPPDIAAFTSDDEIAAGIAYERYKQDGKNPDLKQAENEFILFCDYFTGGAKVKLSIDQLEEIKATLPEQQGKDLQDMLVAIDAKLKTVSNSNRWWDSCTWHSDI